MFMDYGLIDYRIRMESNNRIVRESMINTVE